MKITRFRDILRFTEDGQWACHFPLEGIFRFLKEQEESVKVDLDPDYQRGHVWSEKQQVAWLEFWLRGGKTARVLYFNCPSWGLKDTPGALEIVDGKQRLEALRRFKDNEVQVFGSYRREYTDHIRFHNDIIINVNTLQTRVEVLRWYLDFNTGGVVHSDSEIARVQKLYEQAVTKELEEKP